MRVRYSVSDVAGMMWRDAGTMFLVFALLFTLGGAAAWFLLPKTYTARAGLIVGVGQEYIYQPVGGDAGRGIGLAGDLQGLLPGLMADQGPEPGW